MAKILLTGATGYIGRRLLPILLQQGHQLIALVRTAARFVVPQDVQPRVQVIEGDLLGSSLPPLPQDLDAAYYLVHSMATGREDFPKLEEQAARNFVRWLAPTHCRQIIYLGGLSHDTTLSMHLASRRHVEEVLAESTIPLTVLRAGIIVGAGSASFEIIRDLVEKLPLMIAPRWVSSRCQPIGIRDVIEYLIKVLENPKTYHRIFDIGGPDILTYKEMLLRFARIRHLRRLIIQIPLLTPRLSSFWLYFVTSTRFPLCKALVESLKNNVICYDQSIHEVIPQSCLSFDEAIKAAFSKIEEHAVLSSWRDAWGGSHLNLDLASYIQVPHYGCLKDEQKVLINVSREEVIDRLWRLGEENGWYAMNWAWSLRGLIDKVVGGPGMRRGRTRRDTIYPGDALDFWRVLLADRQKGRLLLYAEMKVPGEAWLEYTITIDGELHQTATFRPRGLLGRLYWYSLYPIHAIIFKQMARKLAQ